MKRERNVEVMLDLKPCPFDGDITNDCDDCVYSGDYHYVDGECVQREPFSLKCGDCLELLKDVPDDSIDLILTDIPYNISRNNNFKTMKDRMGRNGIDFGKWDYGFDETVLTKFVPKLKKGGSMVVFHAFEQFDSVSSALCELDPKDKMVWLKTNPMPRNRERRYIGNIEMMSWYVKKGRKWTFHRQNETYDGCVMAYPSESGGAFKRYHPCQKNLNLLEELICRHSNPEDVVFDPFMGGGSTGVACVNTGRKFIGMELDEQYFKIAKSRIEEAWNRRAGEEDKHETD